MIIKSNGYDILIKNNLFNFIQKELNKLKPKATYFLIADEYVFSLYKAKIMEGINIKETNIVLIPEGENSKSFSMYLSVVDKLIDLDIKRDDLIIAFGGGVIGDLAGFVAATLFRGIDYIQVPTTLLAQVDSSVGAKVAINYKNNKNVLGSFYKPLKVFVDLNFLETLKYENYKDGIAEMIKISLLKDKKLYNHLKSKAKITKNEVAKAINLKNEIVLKDEFDKNLRMLLNFGHTFGHQIELKSNLNHGEAISYGMLIALEIGIIFNKTTNNLYEEIKNVLLSYNLVREPLINKNDYLHLVWQDKKNLYQGLKFVILNEIEQPEIITINKGDLF